MSNESEHRLVRLQVFGCGKNEYGQLGCSMDAIDCVLTPTEILDTQGRGLKWIVGIACGPYHSIIYSSSVMYTFGRNVGQLGHERGKEIIKEPKSVRLPLPPLVI